LTLWPIWISCPGYVPSQLLAHPVYLLGVREGRSAEWQKETALMLCKHCSTVAKILWLSINTILVTNSKHSTMWAAMKKINSILASTHTGYFFSTKNRKQREINIALEKAFFIYWFDNCVLYWGP